MGLKSFNPYTASRRFITVLDKSHITKQEPEKALLEPKKRSGGRNNHGEIVIWHRGGGHKKQYRQVDFRRDKVGVPAKVAAIEYDPNRSSNIALLHYADGAQPRVVPGTRRPSRSLGRRRGAVAQQRRGPRAGEDAQRRSAQVFDRLHGHGWPGWQP